MPSLNVRRPSAALIVSTISLIVALGGTSYAAFSLPANSVGTKQLKNQAVTPPKVAPATIRLFRGQDGPRGPQGLQGTAGQNGTNAATNIVTRYTDTAITANTDVYGNASCNPGEKITGGGFGILGNAFNNSFIIRSGLQTIDPQGATPQAEWTAGVRSTNTGTLRVWAICASQ
jgi:hypothetical protein